MYIVQFSDGSYLGKGKYKLHVEDVTDARIFTNIGHIKNCFGWYHRGFLGMGQLYPAWHILKIEINVVGGVLTLE